jgi:hypothetical protein
MKTKSKPTHVDVAKEADRRARAGAKQNATVFASLAYIRVFAEVFRNSYAEMYAEALEDLGAA